MASAVDPSRSGGFPLDRYWIVPAVRAFLAIAVGCTVALTKDLHTPFFGLVAFGIFATLDGLFTAVLTVMFAPRGVTRTQFVIQGLVGLTAGILALVLSGNGLGMFLYLVTVWALLTGALELYSAIRERNTRNVARDWMFTGGLSVLLAIVLVLIPDDALLAIGLFGAWAVVVGVFQAIGAASLHFVSRTEGQQPEGREQ